MLIFSSEKTGIKNLTKLTELKKWQIWDLNIGSLALESVFLNTTLYTLNWSESFQSENRLAIVYQTLCLMLQLKNVLKHYSSYPNGSYAPVSPRIDSQSYLEKKTMNRQQSWVTECGDLNWGPVERNSGLYWTPQPGVLSKMRYSRQTSHWLFHTCLDLNLSSLVFSYRRYFCDCSFAAHKTVWIFKESWSSFQSLFVCVCDGDRLYI